MSVEFDEQPSIHTFKSRAIILGEPQVPGMAKWLVKSGIVKNENQAEKILLLIIILCVLLSLYLFFFNPFNTTGSGLGNQKHEVEKGQIP